VKKDVTEPRTFCDYCEEPAYTQCLVCGKDLCSKHRLELVIYLNRQDQCFRASLCREDAQPLLPILESYQQKSDTWRKAGHNPEFNEARLAEMLDFMRGDVRKQVPAG